MRTLTAEEKNKVKNLQVSNSIYRRDIKNLVEEIQSAENTLTDLKAQEPDLLGEEHAKVSAEITQVEASIKTKAGQIAYKEGRIAAKEQEIDEIKNKAAREEETVAESYDPNSPEALAEKAAKAAARNKPGSSKRDRKNKKKEEDQTPPTTDF